LESAPLRFHPGVPPVITIKPIDPASEEAQALIAELDQFQGQLYPPESNHLDGAAELKKDHVHFVGAYWTTKLAGIGAVKKFEGYGEIKRMFVHPDHRGGALAAFILEALESHLKERGIRLARLETGIHQPAALRFYEKHGYVKCPPFGGYKPDPQSLFYEKTL